MAVGAPSLTVFKPTKPEDIDAAYAQKGKENAVNASNFDAQNTARVWMSGL